MYISILKVCFALIGFGILVCGFFINFLESLLPSFIVSVFRYGKLSYKENKYFPFNLIEVPKRWFRHFYVVAVIWSTLMLLHALYVYVYVVPIANWEFYILDLIGSSERKVTNTATSTLVALFLFNCQTWRRFYETFFICIYSDSKMNFAHYVVGVSHYIGAVLSLIIESPLFASASFQHRTTTFSFSDVTWNVIVGSALFCWAWYHQLNTAFILANLRKDHRGNVITLDHKIPDGDLFEFVSSPHMFCEAVMYAAIYLIVWGNTTWPYVLFWVVTNQCETALLNHWWYKSKFKTYPKNRKAFIPFVL